ncbi:MAG: hypothetical protein JWP43_1738 [Ramlibacter sp.]|nr:hypothetical protein [Ramlibacter sp.]
MLGVPVRIASITARSEGLIPSFELTDVELLDPQGRTALRLPRVVAALSPRSLWNLGFEQLYIERPELEIRRGADGRILVAGLDFSRTSDNEGRGGDWFFQQTEFVVKSGTVRWVDEARGAPPLALNAVDFVMRNGVRSHTLRLDATPPPEWGERFSLRGLFQQPLLTTHHGQWRDWKGQVYGDFSRVDVSQLQRYANFGIDVSQGHGAVRAWVDVDRAQLSGAVADVVLADVSARLAPDLTPLAVQSMSGRLGGKRLDGGFEFHTQDLQFRTQDGQRWPGGNLFVSWNEAQGARLARGEIRGDRLDLFALGQVAVHLPLGPAAHAALVAYAPKGLVESVQATWQGPLDAVQSYQARGRAVQLELAAQPAAVSASGAVARAGVPGIRGGTVDFDFSQAGGKGRLRIENGALDLPGVFEDPVLAVDELSADLQWQIDGQAISATVSNLKFNNADAQGEGRIVWKTGNPSRGRFPGVLDLQATLNRADGARVHRYLPLGVPKAAREYVRDSVLQGKASAAKFRVRGDLRDFPFKDPRLGEFRVTAAVRDVTFAYVPPHTAAAGSVTWPALTDLSGELVFERNGMQVRNAAGHFAGAPNLQVRTDAEIPEYRPAIVAVNGQVRGPLGEALAFVNNSPVNVLIGRALAKASGNGNADVRLKLELPVAALHKSKVQGSVVLAGNDVQITPDTPVLSRSRATVAFSERGFSLSGAQARALGGDVRLDGGSRGMPGVALPAAGETTIQLRAQGTASAEGLRQARELGFVSRLARDASGSAAYNLTIAFRRGVPEVALASNLQGLALNLPPPLVKAADTVLPLRYENALTRESLAAASGPEPRLQDRVTADLGRVASLVFVRDLGEAEPRVVRGAIAVGLGSGESAALPEQGVSANVNLAEVNLDAWRNVLDRAAGAPVDARAAARAAPPASGYLPSVVAVRARELTVEGRTLHNVVVGGSRDGNVWQANIDAEELNGYAEYRQPVGPGAGRVHARLARLSIAAAAATQVESLLDQQPENLPALDVVVEDFELRGKKLGRLEIDAVNRGALAVAREGGVREWRLNKLNLSMPEAVFSATGNWVALDAQAAPTAKPRSRNAPEPRRTAMKFRLDIADSGQLLARFGMKDVVRRGKGRMEGQVAWLGSPLSLNYPTLDGSFYINMEGGQFLKADPGLAKLLGVLSLQSLPRRLALDFRDVFSQGFAFDFLRGDITIEDGIAATNNLQMKGVNAAVLMEGRADIARETQDLKVVVVPEINAGTASLVATVINPAIGVASFLAQMFLRQPLTRAATQEFHIDGTWADPRIARVGHQSAAEARTDAAAETPRPAGSN